jgi:hypothetical protein
LVPKGDKLPSKKRGNRRAGPQSGEGLAIEEFGSHFCVASAHVQLPVSQCVATQNDPTLNGLLSAQLNCPLFIEGIFLSCYQRNAGCGENTQPVISEKRRPGRFSPVFDHRTEGRSLKRP